MLNYVNKTLLAKECRFLKINALLYSMAGLCAISVNFIPGQVASFISSVLVITVFMVFYSHISIKSVITEKKEKNDLFLMTLPVSTQQLFFSKMVVNWAFFLLLWLLFVGVISAVVMTSNRIPSMVLSSYILIFSLLIAGYSVVFSVGMIMVSEGWAIVALVLSNVVTTVVINLMSNNPEITGSFGLGTFSEIGFIFPSWTPIFMGSMCTIAFLMASITVIVGLRRKEFF